MKKSIIILSLLILTLESCYSQNIKDISSKEEMNYIFARILPKKTITKELYGNSVFITIYNISDSKTTPKSFMEEFMSSYIISIIPDSDYYSESKLYKIEGLLNPKIIDIKETLYPDFILKIEYDETEKRITKSFKLEGVR